MYFINSKNEKQKEYRLRTNNYSTNKYEKTKKGFLMRKYRNMKSRVYGIQKKKIHLYKNKYILNKEEFYIWSLNNKNFNKLFIKWVKSNYNRKLCPTVNRINSKLGYSIDNMEWITHSENSSKISIRRNSIQYLDMF